MRKVDEFEQFMEDHKQEFDFLETPPGVWEKIAEKQDKTSSLFKVATWNKHLLRAAAVAVIFGISFAINYALFNINNEETIATSKKTDTIITDSAALSQYVEYQEAETYFNMQVSHKIQELNSFADKYPDILKDLKHDMSEIDNQFNELKGDLNDRVANKEVVEAMMQTYQIKIKILENVLQLIKEQESKKLENENSNENAL